MTNEHKRDLVHGCISDEELREAAARALGMPYTQRLIGAPLDGATAFALLELCSRSKTASAVWVIARKHSMVIGTPDPDSLDRFQSPDFTARNVIEACVVALGQGEP